MAAADRGSEWVPLGTRVVDNRNRVSIPTTLLDDLDVGQTGRVDVRVTIDGETVVIPSRPINAAGRITIPADYRNEHGIGEGDRIQVAVRDPVDG